ncbi:hypothetical protein B2J93_2947 [Marssonina coronariae]|uniref:Uncharacterized protein n=1 Tax=Diplocarpon coronariae TaxID=2795749 RepID=A0A218Z899_9HELO|nr:hypothetical protein B2J93_2947 [Marssonina coronariae]
MPPTAPSFYDVLGFPISTFNSKTAIYWSSIQAAQIENFFNLPTNRELKPNTLDCTPLFATLGLAHLHGATNNQGELVLELVERKIVNKARKKKSSGRKARRRRALGVSERDADRPHSAPPASTSSNTSFSASSTPRSGSSSSTLTCPALIQTRAEAPAATPSSSDGLLAASQDFSMTSPSPTTAYVSHASSPIGLGLALGNAVTYPGQRHAVADQSMMNGVNDIDCISGIDNITSNNINCSNGVHGFDGIDSISNIDGANPINGTSIDRIANSQNLTSTKSTSIPENFTREIFDNYNAINNFTGNLSSKNGISNSQNLTSTTQASSLFGQASNGFSTINDLVAIQSTVGCNSANLNAATFGMNDSGINGFRISGFEVNNFGIDNNLGMDDFSTASGLYANQSTMGGISANVINNYLGLTSGSSGIQRSTISDIFNTETDNFEATNGTSTSQSTINSPSSGTDIDISLIYDSVAAPNTADSPDLTITNTTYSIQGSTTNHATLTIPAQDRLSTPPNASSSRNIQAPGPLNSTITNNIHSSSTPNSRTAHAVAQSQLQQPIHSPISTPNGAEWERLLLYLPLVRAELALEDMDRDEGPAIAGNQWMHVDIVPNAGPGLGHFQAQGQGQGLASGPETTPTPSSSTALLAE